MEFATAIGCIGLSGVSCKRDHHRLDRCGPAYFDYSAIADTNPLGVGALSSTPE